MTDISKELIEAVRSGGANEVRIGLMTEGIIASPGAHDIAHLAAQAIVAERETRPANMTIKGDVLSDTKIPCDCTPFSHMCRGRRRMPNNSITVETKTLLQDVAAAVDQMLDNAEESA
jgi:hypothetical protein